MPSGEISFEENGLYLLLSDIGAEFHFHWGFYLAKSPEHGIIFHVVNGPHTGHKWTYQTKLSYSVPNSKALLVAMKIAVIDPVVHDSLAERLAQVPVQDSARYGSITCRVWLKEALEELDNEGYIALTADVVSIEAEASRLATQNKIQDVRAVVRSSQSFA